jgi:signal transduction histidine kinase
MPRTNLRKLAEVIQVRQDDLMALWRSKARQVPASRRLDTPTLDDHIRMLLEQLADALLQEQKKSLLKMPADGGGAVSHGLSRLREDFNLTELVAEYNALRDAIQEFAEANRISIAGRVNVIVNRTLDKAIAVAVQSYSEQKTLEIQKQREEHLSFVVHDLRTPLAAIDRRERSRPSSTQQR